MCLILLQAKFFQFFLIYKYAKTIKPKALKKHFNVCLLFKLYMTKFKMEKILHTIIGTTRYNIVKHDQTSLACLPGVSLVNVVVVFLHAARLGDGQTLQQHGDYFEFEKLYFTHRWVYFWHILRGIFYL